MDVFRAKKHENINKRIFYVILKHVIADHCMIRDVLIESNLFEKMYAEFKLYM